MHIELERMQRFLHGELDPSAMAVVREHVAGCADCRQSLERATREEEEVLALLTTLDHSRPDLSASTLIHEPRRQRGARWNRAALVPLLLLGAAGGAYAFPGLPVRGWVDALVDRIATVGPVDTPSPASTTADASTDSTDPSGLWMEPGASTIIVFEPVRPGIVVRVVLFGGAEVRATATDGSATFTADGDRLVIDGTGTATRFEISIPRDAPRVEIRVGDRSLFLKNGDTVTAPAEADVTGAWLLAPGDPGA